MIPRPHLKNCATTFKIGDIVIATDTIQRVDGLSVLRPGDKAKVNSVYRVNPSTPQIIGLDIEDQMPMGDIVCFENVPIKLQPPTAGELAAEICAVLHVPQYEGLEIKGESVRQILVRRVESIIERAAARPDTESVTMLRQRLDHIHSIITEKEAAGIDLEIGSTSHKSVRRWADWRNCQ